MNDDADFLCVFFRDTPTFQSFALAQALPDATLIFYPDSGHAFMFQFPEAFAGEVSRILQ